MEPEETLPPLPDDAFDGRREEASIHKTEPLPKRCDHKGKVTLISATEVRCKCGTGWTGPNIQQLYALLSQPD